MNAEETGREQNAELALYRAIVARMTDGVALIRASDVSIVWINPQLGAILGYAPEKLEGQSGAMLLAPVRNPAAKSGVDIVAALMSTGSWEGATAPRRRDGSELRCRVTISAFEHPRHGTVWLAIHTSSSGDGLPAHAVAAMKGAAAPAAVSEPQYGTTLPVRGALTDDLRRELARARRSGSHVSLAILALDGELDLRDPHVIDELGDATNAWGGTLRATDTIANYEYGEFEYALVLPDCPAQEALMVTDRARKATPGNRTCSAGVATWDGGESGFELAARAHRALQSARRDGGDQSNVARRGATERQ
jgi:PAS domain S-box-containing protein